MNIINANISDLREKLSDYIALARLGKAEISIRNAKSGKEVARIVPPAPSKAKKKEIEKRISELKKLAGFAAGYPDRNRERLEKMGKEYAKKLRKGIIE